MSPPSMGYYKIIFVLLKPLEHKCSETMNAKVTILSIFWFRYLWKALNLEAPKTESTKNCQLDAQ